MSDASISGTSRPRDDKSKPPGCAAAVTERCLWLRSAVGTAAAAADVGVHVPYWLTEVHLHMHNSITPWKVSMRVSQRMSMSVFAETPLSGVLSYLAGIRLVGCVTAAAAALLVPAVVLAGRNSIVTGKSMFGQRTVTLDEAIGPVGIWPQQVTVAVLQQL